MTPLSNIIFENTIHTHIILRDMIYEDIFDYIKWFTKEVEWMNWDAPWEKDIEIDEKTLFQRFLTRYNHLKEITGVRKRFEIVLQDDEQTHIGWVSSYMIDDQFNYNIHGKNIAIGIDIPHPQYRGFGYGYEALNAFIKYLHQHKYGPIYLQTWSGNIPMIELAKKIGFIEIIRISNLRTINHKPYDALTFELTEQIIEETL